MIEAFIAGILKSITSAGFASTVTTKTLPTLTTKALSTAKLTSATGLSKLLESVINSPIAKEGAKNLGKAIGEGVIEGLSSPSDKPNVTHSISSRGAGTANTVIKSRDVIKQIAPKYADDASVLCDVIIKCIAAEETGRGLSPATIIYANEDKIMKAADALIRVDIDNTNPVVVEFLYKYAGVTGIIFDEYLTREKNGN